MLPAAHRLTRPDGFRHAVRRGRRAGSRTLVVHAAIAGEEHDAPPRVGLVVSKAVGNAVVRNRVKRRLRHLAREHIAALPGGRLVVIRALPAAAAASYQELRTDVDRCLTRVVR